MAEQKRWGLGLAVILVIALSVVGLVQLLGPMLAPQSEPVLGATVLERIQPVGRLNLGEPLVASVANAKSDPAPEVAAPATAPGAAAPAAKKAGRTGEQVFNSACMACHGTGAAGAPKLGDKSAWAPRIKQGKAVLVRHAVQGFTGKTGMMPPRGTCGTCSDQELKDAVDFMVSKAQ